MAKKIRKVSVLNNDMEKRRKEHYWQGGLIHPVLGYVVSTDWNPSIVESSVNSTPQKANAYKSLHV